MKLIKKIIFWEDLALIVWIMLLLTSCNNSAIQEKLNQYSNNDDQKVEETKKTGHENQGDKNGSNDVVSSNYNDVIYFNNSGDVVDEILNDQFSGNISNELDQIEMNLSEEQIFEEFIRSFNWLEKIKAQCWLDGQKIQICKLNIDLKNYRIFYAQNKINQRCNFNQSLIISEDLMNLSKGCEGEFDVFTLNINLINENQIELVESYVEKLTRTPDVKIEEEIKILDKFFQ